MKLQQVKIITGGPQQLAYKLDKDKLFVWINDGINEVPEDAQHVMVLEGNTSWSIVDSPYYD